MAKEYVSLYYNGRTSRASLQIVTRQAILLSGEYVELPLLGLFTLGQDDDMLRPTNFCN